MAFTGCQKIADAGWATTRGWQIQELVTPETQFFTEISEASGIQEDNYDDETREDIPINDHSRLAFADINGDGYDDMVFHSLFPNPQAGIPFEHLVFVNNKDGTFTNFSDESGLRNVQSAFFAFGDIDNDSDQDIFSGMDISLQVIRIKFCLTMERVILPQNQFRRRVCWWCRSQCDFRRFQ